MKNTFSRNFRHTRIACNVMHLINYNWVNDIGWYIKIKSNFVSNNPPKDRKSTRLNSSHVAISYAVFCLKKKKRITPGSKRPGTTVCTEGGTSKRVNDLRDE